jgi:hypothetical protein
MQLTPFNRLGLVFRTALLAAVLPAVVASCGGPETVETPPADVTGVWSTDTEYYADRAFEITDETLYIHQGDNTFGAFKIEEVLISHDDLPFYSIEYRGDENAIFSFRFYLSQEGGGTIFFPNQREMRWHRTPDREVPWAALR